MRVGFSGTKKGMSVVQKMAVRDALIFHRATEAHHGCCIGADEDFHQICRELNIPIIGHPPIDESRMMVINPEEFEVLLPAKEYLDRNKDIVDSTKMLIGTPKLTREEFRGSGTWHSIRYARRTKKPTLVLFP